METVFVEVTQAVEDGFNHGKFLVGRFSSEEWARRCEMDRRVRPAGHFPSSGLLGRCGWTARHVLVLDLETGEGAVFRPGGSARADLQKHRVWVCPMFEPFLEWLYEQNLTDLSVLPPLVELPNAPAAMQGYRREGPVLA